MLKKHFQQFLFVAASAVVLAPQGAVAQNIWAGLPDLPDVVDFANWMTPQKAQYFSQGVHSRCSSQATLDRYYYGSLPVCNAFQLWYDEASRRSIAEGRRLDSVLACQRSGNRYCY